MRQGAKVSRRSVLGGVSAAGLSAIGLSAAGSPSFAQSAPAVIGKTKITVTGFYRTPAFHIAQRRGLFAKEGLDVEFLLVRLAPDHNEGLAQGRWPLTMSSADTMLARTTQDGVDFVLFLEAEEGLDVQLIAQSKYKSLQELRGKLFAADPIDSNYDLVRNKIMRDNGIPESEYRYEVIGNSSVRLSAFLDGKVDAAMLQPPFSHRPIEKGGVLLGKGSDYIQNWPICCGWGLRKWMEANRSVAVGFTRAMALAADWLLLPENKEEMIQILMKEEKLTRAWAESNYAYVVPNACCSRSRSAGISSCPSSPATTSRRTSRPRRSTTSATGPRRPACRRRRLPGCRAMQWRGERCCIGCHDRGQANSRRRSSRIRCRCPRGQG